MSTLKLEYISLRGDEARAYLTELASLRLEVFKSYPYLYEGTLEYETEYLETYFKSQRSFIYLVKEGSKIVGATTGIVAADEEENFRKPFQAIGIDPAEVFYFGESILKEEYRGRGIGKTFFKERENFARGLGGIKLLSFCAVVRPDDHPLKPQGYRDLAPFWKQQGFEKQKNLVTTYKWKDVDSQIESSKTMQFWIKK